MSIQRTYCRAMATELSRHAVWEPGSPMGLGDYGILNDGSLMKLGNIEEFALPQSLKVELSKPSSVEFASAGTKVLLIDPKAEVKLPSQLGPVDGSAELRISFEHANSIYLRAAKLVTEEIANIDAVARILRTVPSWHFNWVVVSKVAVAWRLSLILSAKERAEVSVHAATDVLKAFDSGSASANLNVSIAGDAAFKVVGASGPVFFDCIRLRRVLGGVKRGAQPGGIALKPYEMVPPEASDDSTGSFGLSENQR